MWCKKPERYRAGDNPMFVCLIAAATDDHAFASRLKQLLSLPSIHRTLVLEQALTAMRLDGAPDELMHAFAALGNDEVADAALRFLD
jgi:hypothetical protein